MGHRLPLSSVSDLFAQIDRGFDVRHRGDAFRLCQGDSLDLLAKIPEESVDLIFADPPYMLSNGGTTCASGKRVAVNKGKWDVSAGIASDHEFNLKWLAACKRVLKPSGTIWVSGTQHVIFSIGFAMQSLGYHLLNTVTWFKPNASPNLACRFFTHSTEIVLWASPSRRAPLPHTFNYREMKEENGGKQMRDLWAVPEPDGTQIVWNVPTPGKSEKLEGKHPTQKPLALLDRIVRSASSPGEIVLDPFNGSGTTGLAAVRLGRRFVGVDLSTEYLDLAARRLRTATVSRATPERIAPKASANRRLPGRRVARTR